MLDKLNSVEASYEELTALLSTPSVQSDSNEYRKHAKALAEIEPLVEKAREYKAVLKEIEQAEDIIKGGDADMRELAQEELDGLKERRDALLAEIKILLIPKDPNDQKNVMLEIRAGTGGEEAALFAYELFRMYRKFAEKQGWRVELMSTSESDVGGVKEVIATIEGRGAYSKLKYESGVHRVQRVPATEAQRPHPYLDGHRRRAARSRRGRRADQCQRSAHRHILLERARRPERQHHVLGRAHHAHSDQHRRLAAGREVADQEQGEGDARAPRAALRHGNAASSRTRSRRTAAARSAPASARRKSGPITSRKTVLPTIACPSRSTASPKS